MAQDAVNCFLSQTYLNKELVILDDEDCPSFPNGIDHPLIYYTVVKNERAHIPLKRNRNNALAHGEIIMHFDSDDWSHPDRMSVQVAMLEKSGKPVAAFSTMHWWHREKARAYFYEGIVNEAVGNSLCYTKAWWETHPFNESKYLGTDTAFCRTAQRADMLVVRPADHLMVGLVHSGNSSSKVMKPPFIPCATSELPPEYLSLHGL